MRLFEGINFYADNCLTSGISYDSSFLLPLNYSTVEYSPLDSMGMISSAMDWLWGDLWSETFTRDLE